MIRKCATAVFGLALVVVLGFGIARMHTLKIPAASVALSVPCEPASPAFDAGREWNAVSTLDSGLGAEDTAATTHIAQELRAGTVTQALRQTAPRSFPPLWRRPPPANS